MPIPVQQFNFAPSGLAQGLSQLLKGGMSGYKQGLQVQQAKQQMRHQDQLQKAMEEKLKQQNVMQQQFGQLMGHAAVPGQQSPGVPYRDVPAQQGTGYLGGKISDDEMRKRMAKYVAATGDYGKAASIMFPREQEQTAMQRNLSASGFKPGTPEYEQAAQSLLTKGLLPTTVKQARYASDISKGIIDNVNDENVIDAVAGFSGAEGSAKKLLNEGLATFGKSSPEYDKYFTFVHNTVPALGSEIRRLLGDNASNEQIKQIENLVNPASWSGNPELVKSRWNQLQKLHDIASKAISKSPLELSSEQGNVPRGTQSGQQTLRSSSGAEYSIEDVMKAARGGI